MANNSMEAANTATQSVNTNTQTESKTMKQKKRNSQWIWYIFLIPSFVGILLFMVYPIAESLRLSFFKSNGTIETFTGLQTYFSYHSLLFFLQCNSLLSILNGIFRIDLVKVVQYRVIFYPYCYFKRKFVLNY